MVILGAEERWCRPFSFLADGLMHQVLARKWRPKNFQELVGQQHVTQALSYALDHQHFHHAYLFTGTRGVGKTTIARIFAKSINCLTNGISSQPCGECEHCREIDAGNFPDLIEVDAASRTQVDNTRQLLNSVPYMPIKGRFKVYLIDEVHMLSDGSFNALLKTLEEPPEHVKFILATTDPQKIPATVISRCLQFQLKNMSTAQIAAHLQHILQSQQTAFETEALGILAEAAQGSMRDSLSLLDQAIAYGQGRVLTQDVAALLGAVPAVRVRALFRHLAAGNAQALRQEYAALESYAPDYSDLLRRILQTLQSLTIAQLQAQRFADEVHADMVDLAAQLPLELVQLWYQIATDAWQSLPYQPDAAMAVEMMLLRMLALQPVFPEQDLAQVRPIDEAALQPSAVPDLHHLAEQLQEAAEQEQSAHAVAPALPSDDREAVPVSEDSVFHEPQEMPPWEEAVASPAQAASDEAEMPPRISRELLEASINAPAVWQQVAQDLPLANSFFVKENMYPVSYAHGHLQMAADEAGKVWASAAHLQQLAQQLSAAVGEKIQVSLAEQAEQQTVFQHRHAQLQTQELQLREEFLQHPAVQALEKEFDARIDENSIRFLDSESH